MNLVIGKLYQFIDRSYHDFFYLVTNSDHEYNRHCQIDNNNILFLSDSFMLLDIGKPCMFVGRKIWIKVLSGKGLFGWFRIEPAWLEELTDE